MFAPDGIEGTITGPGALDMACACSAALMWALAEAGLVVEPEAEEIRAAAPCL